MVAFCAATIAQKLSVTGKVTDSTGASIPGASVKVKGTKTGVSADALGQFKLSVDPGAVLIISATGFLEQQITASENIQVNLKSDSRSLSEVVVTALGVQRQARELGYSTVKVKASELTQAKVVNLQNGLTGKVSGLNIQTTNNGVFADTRITLRGIRSLTGNNQPMLILDGVPLALSYISSRFKAKLITTDMILKSEQ